MPRNPGARKGRKVPQKIYRPGGRPISPEKHLLSQGGSVGALYGAQGATLLGAHGATLRVAESPVSSGALPGKGEMVR